MKQCPACNRTYTDDDLLFCLEDGTQLQTVTSASDAPTTFDGGYDPNKTLAFSPARDTSPPLADAYTQTPATQPPAQKSWSPPAPQYAQMPQAQSAQKSGGKGWIIVAVAAVLVLGIGIVVLLAIIGKQSSDTNTGSNTSANRASASNISNSSGTNANRSTTTAPPAHFKDDFSTQNWPTGESGYGSFYDAGEYHMKGKPNLYVFMFPYNTGNYASRDADVKVTARSVDGHSPEYGYGLIMHGKIKDSKLDGYGFLIYTGSQPKYEIVRFDSGTPSTIVKWDDANMLRTGTATNEIEVRAKGSQLLLYLNGQFVNSVTDTSNITDGYAGLYTSETNEVAFDNMEISR
ncbi:MAG: hypothetical protein M3362_13760 [Acidobacteriota bacterium]|nr:hypothetical protein [Acidobacteriota bacterium]